MTRYSRMPKHFKGQHRFAPKKFHHHDAKELEKTTDFTPQQKRKVEKVLHEYKEGELETHGREVTSRKQAVAIALSEARSLKHHSPSVHSGEKIYHVRLGAGTYDKVKATSKDEAARKWAQNNPQFLKPKLRDVYETKQKAHTSDKQLAKGTMIEHKEHPEFTRKQASMIARDHLRKKKNYYD